jgi:VIT1/CCC1 family predicted Fe2+/Mn2+ transporter
MARGSFRRQAEVHPGHRSVSGGLARAAVFGMSDGLISNVSLVIGFSGSGVDASVVRLAGFAGAIAGSISMAVGEWISISAQNELVSREVAIERHELVHNRRAELSELASMYENDGMEPDTARQAASEVMRSTDAALLVHSREEFGVDPELLPRAVAAAALSFLCFLVGALVPVVPWMIGSGNAAKLASIVGGLVAAGLLGWAIGRLADRSRVFTVLRQMAILLVACGVTYGIGELLHVDVG